MSLKELVKTKRDVILSIAQCYGASNVRIFGSVASGRSHTDSDVDFLVHMEPGHSLLEWVEARFRGFKPRPTWEPEFLGVDARTT